MRAGTKNISGPGSRRRGRPREYDPETALLRALETFWAGGYAATTLDELSAATGMNRPSLYGAFGDKEALYLKALERYWQTSREAITAALALDRPLRAGLRAVYAGALSLYLSGPSSRGCLFIGTAATEAVRNPRVRAELLASCRELDRVFSARLQIARARGEIDAASDPVFLGQILSAVLHTIAIRARAGETREALEATAASAIDLVCGPERKPRSRR